MSKNKGKKKGKDGGKSRGIGKVLLMMTLVLGVGGAALWFFAPEQVEAQMDGLKNLLGL